MAAEQTSLAIEEELQTVQMQLKPTTMKRLQYVSELMGAKNGASAVATSIQITEEVLKNINAGGKLYVESPNGQRVRLTFEKTA